jgi:hypothetical protein
MIASMLQDLDWEDEVEVRLREEGQVYFGEAFVVPIRRGRYHGEDRGCPQAGSRPRLEDL